MTPSRGRFFNAHYHMEKEKYDSAEQEYLKLADAYPEDPEIYFALGRIYQEKKEYERAFEQFDESLKRDPNHMNSLYQYGRTAVFTGNNLDRGVACFLTFFEGGWAPEAPSMSNAHWRLGMLYEKKDEEELAREHYEAALALDPDHEAARKALEKL